MKINDIYNNLEETLDIKGNKRILGVKNELIKDQIIDTLKEDLDEIILQKNNKIKIIKSNNNIDGIKKEKLNKINLKKIITNSKKISYKIKSYILNIINYFKIKNTDNKKRKSFKIIAYMMIFFSLILFDKIIIENLTSSGIQNLYNIKSSTNIESVESQLSKAKTKFNIANILFIPFKIIPVQKLINANNGIGALNEISGLGLDFIDYYKDNLSFIKKKELGKIYFSNLLQNAKPFFIKTENNIKKIQVKLNKISLDKNNNNYSTLNKVKEELTHINNKLSIINNNFDTFLNILGKDRAKKYFIVFQNNDEIRPTGGFMGSAGIVEIFAGKIKSFEQKDIYAYEWEVNKNYNEKVIPPSGVKLLSERLGLRDSNAFINYSTSAKSINYFMKKGGYNIDGVIFINQKIILDILKNIGEIDFGKYNSKITHKNFSEIISLLVEAKVSKSATLDTPKQVLFDFSNLLKNKIIKEKKYPELLNSIISNINSRDLVIYSFNKQENNLLKELNLTGFFDYKNQTDFNYPFFISVGGNKTDRYISRKYIKNIEIKENTNNNKCSLNTNFEIILENTFNNKDEKRIKSEMKNFRIKTNTDLLNIAGKGINQDYTKVVIPENAILNEDELKNNGYTIIDHKEYKTIEKLLKTKSGDKSSFNFKYKIDNIECKNNKIKIYKQAGIYKYDIIFNYLSKNKKEKIKLDGLNQDFYYNSEK